MDLNKFIDVTIEPPRLIKIISCSDPIKNIQDIVLDVGYFEIGDIFRSGMDKGKYLVIHIDSEDKRNIRVACLNDMFLFSGELVKYYTNLIDL